jgi:hypothetical protein
MTEQRNQLADLFAACWKDEALKQRFMADPKTVLAEYGMDVPDGMAVNVVENADNTVHITMPAPPSGGKDLSDDELSNAAGGGAAATAFTPFSIVPDDQRPFMVG